MRPLQTFVGLLQVVVGFSMVFHFVFPGLAGLRLGNMVESILKSLVCGEFQGCRQYSFQVSFSGVPGLSLWNPLPNTRRRHPVSHPDGYFERKSIG